MHGIRKVLENSFLYTFSNLLVRAIGFLLLPLYTLFLTPEDYGITNLVNSFTTVATYIVAFSLYSAVVRFYADYKDDREKLKRFYGTVVTFTALSGIVFVGIMWLLRGILVSWFFEGIAFYPFVALGLTSLTFISLHTVHQSVLKGMQTGRKLTAINLTVCVFQIAFTLLFISVFKMGAMGVLLASLVIELSYSVYMVLDLKRNDLITFGIDKSLLRESLQYSIPLMPHNLSTNIATFAARVFINNNSPLAVVGLYSVGIQFGNIIDTVQVAVNQAFAPWFFDAMNQGGDSGKLGVVTLSRYLLIIYSVIYMIIGLFSQEVLILMTTPRYYMAWTVIPILVVGFSVKSIYYFFVNILFYYREAANKIFISTITGSLADIVLASIFVKHYGMYGAALSFVIAKIIIVSIVVAMSKAYDDLGYRVTDMLRTIIPSLLFMASGLYFSYTRYLTVFSWSNLFYKFGVLLVYLVFLYLTNKRLVDRFIQSRKIRVVLPRQAI